MMRRKLIVGSIAAAAAAPLAFASGGRLQDARLLGAWRSDRERTIAHWKFKETASAESRTRIEAIFGRLTLRFTAIAWESEYEDTKTNGRYEVVAKDETSVVIRLFTPGEQRVPVTQYFFEKDAMYVVSGYNLEFFKRVEV